MNKKLHQTFQVPFEYNVLFTKGVFDPDNRLLIDALTVTDNGIRPKVLVIVDDGLLKYHSGLLAQIDSYFASHRQSAELVTAPICVAGGELCKNDPQFVQEILEAVNQYGVDRHSYTIAVGGGAVLDMAGYASSIAHRGIKHIRIPTTVLSQNDSGIGVKNAINAFGKKNFIGCFAPPAAVINDIGFLHSLQDRDWRAGISEAVKVSLIKDREFFDFLEDKAEALAARDLPAMERLIFDCARLHMEHIASGDPFEMGSSRPLDFGHWSAHKLEQLSDYELRHGEAVAIGIALDTTYSYLTGLLDRPSWERVIRLFIALGFDIYTPYLEAKVEGQYSVLLGLEEFREHLGGLLTIMLLKDLGIGIETNKMDPAIILKSIEKLKELQPALSPG